MIRKTFKKLGRFCKRQTTLESKQILLITNRLNRILLIKVILKNNNNNNKRNLNSSKLQTSSRVSVGTLVASWGRLDSRKTST